MGGSRLRGMLRVERIFIWREKSLPGSKSFRFAQTFFRHPLGSNPRIPFDEIIYFLQSVIYWSNNDDMQK